MLYKISGVSFIAEGIDLEIVTALQPFFSHQAHQSYQTEDLRLQLSEEENEALTEKQMLQHYTFQVYTGLCMASCKRKAAHFNMTHCSWVRCHCITTSAFPPLSAVFATATSYTYLLTLCSL